MEKEMSEKKSNKKWIIILVILFVCIGITFGVIKIINSKDISPYVEPSQEQLDMNSPVVDYYVKKTNNVNIYGEKLYVKIPKINATLNGAKILNSEILANYKKIIEEIKRNSVTPYEINYTYTYEPNMKYLYINITTKIIDNISIKTYIYNVKQDKEIYIQDLFANYGITLTKLKSRIKALGKLTVDINRLDDEKVLNNLSIKYLDISKITLVFSNGTESCDITYSSNEKVTFSMAMDAINEKKR